MQECRCCFCNNTSLSLLYSGHFHRVKKDHGPFDFYRCQKCHSGLTRPLPTRSQLQTLYGSFAGGMDETTRKNRDANPLTIWYRQCIERGLQQLPSAITTGSDFTWIDIGAGKGELAKLMSEQYPNSKGLAIDFHPRPELLGTAQNVDWLECDLNDPLFAGRIETRQFDLALSITVLEHVRTPDLFIKNILPLLKDEGAFYLTVPDFSSFAARFLKSKWPYYLPGEHLNIPSKKGMEILLHNLSHELGMIDKGFNVFCKRIILPYSLSYYLQYLRINILARLPGGKNIAIKLPTGILEAGIKPRVQGN